MPARACPCPPATLGMMMMMMMPCPPALPCPAGSGRAPGQGWGSARGRARSGHPCCCCCCPSRGLGGALELPELHRGGREPALDVAAWPPGHRGWHSLCPLMAQLRDSSGTALTIPEGMVFQTAPKGNMEQLMSPCSVGHWMRFQEGLADSVSPGFLFLQNQIH